ncbi:N-acetylneuraminate synthase family protein [Candidatus Pelagibacter sp. Uisw_113]|uniref:N-acetylneuraminate synthase family protein n=1 Tax=Candidatus Pelagibacter sp. Uisw_113 TaxID=3230994 RepID=UPI0039EB7164
MKTSNSFFDNLFILDLANNHFGDIAHAKKVIDSFGQIIKKNKIKAAVKFQFRDLDTFVHKTEINNKDNKYVQRFLSTKLSFEKFYDLKKYLDKNKILTACTPFDEKSIDHIEKMKFDLLKIASVSSNEWSLIERSAKNNIPKLISTGGKTIEMIDKIVSFFSHNKQDFALMHCMAIYPSPNDTLQLKVISDLIKRYPDVKIGWSTHEDPDDLMPSTIAKSLGAKIFEKHIGINSKKYKLNNYSTNPSQFLKYLENLQLVEKSLGILPEKIIDKRETNTLSLLERGVYVKKDIKKNEKLNEKNIYFAFPKKKNQLSNNDFSLKSKEYIAFKDIKKDQSIQASAIKVKQHKSLNLVTKYIHKVKAILNYAKIDLGSVFDLEISHHYGVKNFPKFGCFLFNCINRGYAKKIIVLFPNQKHPLHKHKLKEETFQILSGVLYSELDGKEKILYPGDTQVVMPGVWHKFKTDKRGCIFEEVSSTHYNSDSIYQDSIINKLTREERKTFIKNWGTHELTLDVKK